MEDIHILEVDTNIWRWVMRIQEKLQYKLRNFLYEKDRERLSKKQNKGIGKQENSSQGQESKGVSGMLEEMDEYLGEKFKSFDIRNKKSN